MTERLPRRSVLSDVNDHLVCCWRAVRDRPLELSRRLRELRATHCPEQYYAMRERYNTELANDLGNLVSRSVSMAVKYFEGDLPALCDLEKRGPDAELLEAAEKAVAGHGDAFARHAVDEAIAAAWVLIRRANQYIEETSPWKLAKDEASRPRLATVMNALLESVRIAALLLTPIMPGKCAEIRARLASPVAEEALRLADARWAPLEFRPAGTLSRPAPLFPRIELAS